MKRQTHCSWCAREFDAEERASPRKSDAGDRICDSCFREHYEDYCTRCGELFEKTELSPRPGRLIGIWRDSPAVGRDDLIAGYYRVLSWPIYSDGMIEGFFHPWALKRILELDERGKVSAEQEHALAGPMCEGCRGEIERQIPHDTEQNVERQP